MRLRDGTRLAALASVVIAIAESWRALPEVGRSERVGLFTRCNNILFDERDSCQTEARNLLGITTGVKRGSAVPTVLEKFLEEYLGPESQTSHLNGRSSVRSQGVILKLRGHAISVAKRKAGI
jgi:hypothetical protein